MATSLVVFAGVIAASVLYQNPFGELDETLMMTAIANFVDMFRPAIIVLVGVFAGAIVIRGIRSIFGGGG